MSLLIIISPLFFSLLAAFTHRRANAIFAALLIGTVLLIRYGVGYDYFSYERITQGQASFNFSFLGDLLNQLAFLTQFPNGFMGIAAVLQAALLIRFFYWRGGSNMGAILFVALPFYYIESYTTVRQSLAGCVVLLSLMNLSKRRSTAALFWYGVASLVHASAVLSLPMYYFLKALELNLKSLLRLSLSAVALVLIYQQSLDSDLVGIYLSYDQEGWFFVIVTGLLLLSSFVWGDQEQIKIFLFGFIFSIVIHVLLGYVFYRLLLFAYLPLFLCQFRFKTWHHKSLFLFTLTLIFSLSIYVRYMEERNGFQQFETIL